MCFRNLFCLQNILNLLYFISIVSLKKWYTRVLHKDNIQRTLYQQWEKENQAFSSDYMQIETRAFKRQDFNNKSWKTVITVISVTICRPSCILFSPLPSHMIFLNVSISILYDIFPLKHTFWALKWSWHSREPLRPLQGFLL